MKVCKILLGAIILLGLLRCNAQNGTPIHTKISQAEKDLNQHPHNQQAWQQLYTLMNENYIQLTAEERSRLRKILEQYYDWSTGTLYTASEPAQKLL